jgi:glycosyltransferase involved in cell wall biosynthesis
MKHPLPKVSVCIPVYNSEPVLRRCLDSVINQDFTDFEIIVVNDGSAGTDEAGLTCKKIVKQAQKSCPAPLKSRIKYIEHRNNLGLLEARRTAVHHASGEYICNVDSDDALTPGALTVLYEAAKSYDADIVQGKTDMYSTDPSAMQEKSVQKKQKEYNKLAPGVLSGSEVFDGFMIRQNHIGLLWAKLFRRETYLRAFSYIPFTNCVMAEDLLQYFFIAYEAKKYVGIQDIVYCYTVDTGISSSKKITDISRWEQICSTANVFTIIFSAIKQFPQLMLSSEQMEAFRLQSRSYLVSNLQQLKSSVVPELQEEARNLLCEYWGEDFVQMMEKAIEREEQKSAD